MSVIRFLEFPMLRSFAYALAALLLNGTAMAGPAPQSAAPPALQAFAGKIVYVDFWASWCAPCAESFPWLNTLQQRFGPRLVVVGVNVDENQADAERFLQRHPAQFAIIRDAAGELASHYDIPGMPTSLILDEAGNVVHLHSGFRKNEVADYEAAIAKALDHPPREAPR